MPTGYSTMTFRKKIVEPQVFRFPNLHQITDPLIDLHLMKQQ